MRLGRMLLIVAVLLVVVVVAVVAAGSLLGGSPSEADLAAEATAEAATHLKQVVVLSEPVLQGEKISADKVITSQILESDFLDIMFTETNQVVGLYARGNYEVGDALTNTMLVSNPQELLADLGSDHAALIPSGLVAVPVPISRFSGLGWGLTVGDRVNVIATISFVDLDTQFQTLTPNHTAGVIAPGTNLILGIETTTSGIEGESTVEKNVLFDVDSTLPYANLVAQSATGGSIAVQGRAELDSVLNQPFYFVPSEEQRPRIVTQTVMFNKIVLHVGDFELVDDKGQEVIIEEAPAPEGEEAAAPDAPPPPPPEPVLPDIVTLIVSPQEAVTLNYLIYSGAQLTLALRPPGDDPVIPTDAVTLQYLLDAYRIPLPIKLPYGIDAGLIPPVLTNDIPEETP